MKRQDILDNYEVQNGRIVSPGKFEGEPVFGPALWELGLEGFADYDDGRVYGFRFTKDDPVHAEFPELRQWLGRKRSVRLVENECGFVRAY